MTEQKLDLTMRENHAVRAAYSQYLNFSPRFVTEAMVNALARDCGISCDEAFLTLFSAAIGLGLGYFAFHAIQKGEVQHLTVVERDRDVIDLFRSVLLPQFPNAEKLEIVQADAFDFLKDPKTLLQYDSVFADLWHDPSDGLDLYIRLRKIETKVKADKIDYWIEPTLLSTLRDMVYDRITDKSAPLQIQGISKEEMLSNRFLRELAPSLEKE